MLFVCLGNICRSPTAEGVLRAFVEEAGLSERIAIDSAGTYAYHAGEPPDRRSQQAAALRGYDLSALRGRRALREDFTRFDYILAMDRSNLADLRALRPAEGKAALHLFLEFAPSSGFEEVPDPYGGGEKGFDLVLDLIEEASRGFLAHLRREHAAEFRS